MTGAGTVGLLRAQVSANRAAYGYVMTAAILATVPGIAVPLLARVFVDQYLVAANRSWALPIIGSMLVALAVTSTLVWLQFAVVTRLAVRLSAAQSAGFAWHVLRLPVADVQAIGPGDLAARSGSTQRNANATGLLLPLALANIATIIVYAAALLALDLPIGLVSLLVVVGSLVAGRLLIMQRHGVQELADDASLALTARTAAVVGGIETVKAAAWEAWVFDRWSQEEMRRASAYSALAVDSQRLGLVPTLTQSIGLGLVLVVGAYLVFAGSLSLGTLVASQALLVSLLVPTGQLAWMGSLIESVRSVGRQLAAVTSMDVDLEVTGSPVRSTARGLPAGTSQAAPRRDTGTAVALDLRGVSFGYDPQAAPLLSGVSVSVPAGTWLAVVGSSGSGKSTLARLVVGETQPWSGQITLDGTPRLSVPRWQRAELLGYVPQSPVLMPGTIAQNVTMFDETITREQVASALAEAFILEAVLARPSGLDEHVGPTGHGFSGGELQRIAIARALVRSPGLLVLDEATSALDPIVEAELGIALRARACTCVIVAHRLSTVRDADQIIVLEGGKLVQQGTFDELRAHGRFAELVHG